jgi:hypothetical protein
VTHAPSNFSFSFNLNNTHGIRWRQILWLYKSLHAPSLSIIQKLSFVHCFASAAFDNNNESRAQAFKHTVSTYWYIILNVDFETRRTNQLCLKAVISWLIIRILRPQGMPGINTLNLCPSICKLKKCRPYFVSVILYNRHTWFLTQREENQSQVPENKVPW